MKYAIATDLNGNQFQCTIEQFNALKNLSTSRKGGFAKVYGYKPSSGYKVSPVHDISIITRFSVDNLYRRKIAELESVTFDEIKPFIEKDELLKLQAENVLQETFNARKTQEIESMNKTLDGERGDERRKSHDRCYAPISMGVKVHFKTAKGDDGLTAPILENGLPVADSIMITYLEIAKDIIQSGEKKIVNSGIPVRISNAIKSVLNKRSVGIKTMSLKPDNFDRLVMSGKEYIPANNSQIDSTILV